VVDFDGGLSAEIVDRGEFGERTVRFECAGDLYETLEAIGHTPLPPYIHRQDTEADRNRYQTVFARERGSVAAPTAGLHFTPEVLGRCRDAGAEVVYVTLHVGLGTFWPLHADVVEEATLHSEVFRIDPESWDRIRSARRVVATGTTSVRSIEARARGDAGETDIFIYPGFDFQVTGAILTNFHLPKSSLLLLVCAFGGRELILDAYRHAVEQEYRFYSYGDCLLVL
jgi:S-adenosylmethionine:tRNA ribosyltransferase-isomerase